MNKDKLIPFVSYLERLRGNEDRAALAALRRALGRSPASAVQAQRYIVPWLPSQAAPWQEELYYLVASLFAMHPQPGGQGSLGSVLARVASEAGESSTERRFMALLNCHVEELGHHLRYAVSLARTKQVPIDWHQLFRDLRYWDHPDRYVQRRWARDFWAAPLGAEELQTNSEEDQHGE